MKSVKKKKITKRCLVITAVIFAVFVFLVVVLTHKPKGFTFQNLKSSKEVNSYLTHVLAPQIYNGLETGEYFELPIDQRGLNQIISQIGWPKTKDGFSFSVPKVIFGDQRIALFDLVTTKGIDFMVSVYAKPGVDSEGLLNFNVEAVKIGAVNASFLARLIASQMYEKNDKVKKETNGWRKKIAGSLIRDEAFRPVFDIYGQQVLVKKVKIERGKLTLGLLPIFK